MKSFYGANEFILLLDDLRDVGYLPDCFGAAHAAFLSYHRNDYGGKDVLFSVYTTDAEPGVSAWDCIDHFLRPENASHHKDRLFFSINVSKVVRLIPTKVEVRVVHG